MYCTKCGAEIPAGSAKCPQCGHEAPVMPVASPSKPKWLLVGILGLLVIGAAVAIFRPLGPEEVASRFAEALKKGAWNKAYSFFNFGETLPQQLGAKEFAEAQEALTAKNGKIVDVKLDLQPEWNAFQGQLAKTFSGLPGVEQYSSEKYREYLLIVTREKSGEERFTLAVTKNKSGWRVVPDSFVEVREISTFPGVHVAVNGQEITPSQGNGLRFYAFCGWPCKISFSAPEIKSCEVETSERYVTFSDFEPSDTLAKEVVSALDAYIKSISGKERTYFFDTYKDVLRSVKYGKVSFAGSLNRVVVSTQETWDETKTSFLPGISNSASVSQSVREVSQKYSLVFKDGKWQVE